MKTETISCPEPVPELLRPAFSLYHFCGHHPNQGCGTPPDTPPTCNKQETSSMYRSDAKMFAPFESDKQPLNTNFIAQW